MEQKKSTPRPAICTDAMLDYLDDLRESGETNMFGAASYLDREFSELWEGCDPPRSYRASKNAHAVLQYWMDSFVDRRSVQA